jgi:outer membrane protein with beta-barrel domain
MKIIILLGVLIGGDFTASAQAVTIGLKGEIPLIEPTGSHDESRPYVVGASVEVRLPARFAIEADALYRRIGSSSAFSIPQGSAITTTSPITTSFFNRQRGNSYEFPVLGKYYLRSRESGWQPFLATGYAFRVTQFSSDTSETNVDAGGLAHTSSFHSNYGSGLGVGAVFGVGVRVHAGRFALLPEFRYSRWGAGDNNLTRKNEAGLLLGISF